MTATTDDLASPDHVCKYENCQGFRDLFCGCLCHAIEDWMYR